MNTDIDEGNRTLFKDKLNEEIPPRRIVLRGALAVGCGLLLPATLFGCDSKKGETSTGAAPSGSPPTSTDSAAPYTSSSAPSEESAAPTATAKASQASVQYQSQPKGDQKCDGCLHFIAESNSCKLVEGQISSDGWCSLWAQKA